MLKNFAIRNPVYCGKIFIARYKEEEPRVFVLVVLCCFALKYVNIVGHIQTIKKPHSIL